MVSIGLAGALGPDAIARVAPDIERAGFHALWVNDTPGGDSIACLAAAARVTDRLVLATGVVPLDRRPAGELLAAVRQAGLPQDRLMLGVGSGGASRGALRLVREGVGMLRDGLRAPIVVGALGPRMRRLGAEAADGVVLNWLTPDAAAAQRDELHAIDAHAQVTLYTRTALDVDAVARRDAEADRYGTIPNYAANFARLGFGPRDAVLGSDGLAERVAAYTGAVDELVLRAVTAADDVAALRRFVAAAADVLP